MSLFSSTLSTRSYPAICPAPQIELLFPVRAGCKWGIEVDTSLPAERVVCVLEQLLLWRAQPPQIRMDNGSELISQRLESWAKERQVELLHIQPGKPAQNAYIGLFNRNIVKRP